MVLGALTVLAFGMALNSLRQRLSVEEAEAIEEGVLLKIKVPKMSEQGPLAAEMMFSALHGMLQSEDEEGDLLSFEIVSTPDGISFYVYVPKERQSFVESQIYAQYPTAEIKPVEDYARNLQSRFLEEESFKQEETGQEEGRVKIVGTELILERPYFYPIKTFPNFEVDPLSAITSAMENLGENEQMWLQMVVKPLPEGWQEAGYEYLTILRTGKEPDRRSLLRYLGDTFLGGARRFLGDIFKGILLGPSSYMGQSGSGGEEAYQMSPEQKEEEQAIQRKLALLGFETNIRVIGVALDEESAQRNVSALVAAFKQFAHGSLNGLVRGEIVKNSTRLLDEYVRRAQPAEIADRFVLNTEELASIFHLPSSQVSVPNIDYSHAKKAEPPLDLPVDAELKFAQTLFRERVQEFGIYRDDRRRHMYVLGKTGTGKSTLLLNMVKQDIKNGEGVAFLDPHGDAFEELLESIPRSRVEDVIVFDPSDQNYPVAFNMFELYDPEQKDLVTAGLIDVFKKRFEFSWGPRMEHLLRNTFLTFLEIPHSTLLGVLRILQDKSYRKYIVDLLEDPILIEFWEKEFYDMASNPRLVTEAIAPIQNRLGPFLATPTIRNIVGQARSTLDLPKVMNERKILLVNLSKGKIGDDASNVLGGFLMSRLWFAALTRARMPEEHRQDFYVYVDEFQNFATGTFATILSEARKYRLNLIMANQFLNQLRGGLGNGGGDVLEAIFGNVGTVTVFAVGQEDAHILAREFAPVFEEGDLMAMERHQINLRLMINGQQSRPFSARTLPPIPREGDVADKEEVIARSRAKYARPREKVEAAIRRWSKRTFAPGQDREEVQRQRASLYQQYQRKEKSGL